MGKIILEYFSLLSIKSELFFYESKISILSRLKSCKDGAGGIFLCLRDTTTESSGRDDGSKHPLRPSPAAPPLWWCNTQVTVCRVRWKMSQGAMIHARPFRIFSQSWLGRTKNNSCLLNQILFDHFDQPSVTDVLDIVNFCCVLQICLAHRRYRGFIRPM